MEGNGIIKEVPINLVGESIPNFAKIDHFSDDPFK